MSVTSNSPFEGSFARAEVDMVSNILEGKNHRGSTLRDSEGNDLRSSLIEKEVVVSDLDDLEPDNEDTFEQPEVIEEEDESDSSSCNNALDELSPSKYGNYEDHLDQVKAVLVSDKESEGIDS